MISNSTIISSKKVLLLGDYKAAVWHPLTDMENTIIRVLDGFDITICEDYPSLTLNDFQAYNMIINYVDAWDKRANSDFAGALLGYVAGGGSLLTLHNGIIAHNLPEVEQMIGAAFTGHPQHEPIEYVYTGAHPVTNNMQPFSLDEEPYMFTMDNLAHVHIIMEYLYKGEKYPAAWLRYYGRGKSCYLSMGHTAVSFANECCGGILRRATLWCMGEPG